MAESGRSGPGPFAHPAGGLAALSGSIELALDAMGLSLTLYRTLAFCALRPATPTDVAFWRQIRKQGVSRQLNLLVEKGYLTREADVHDRRRLVHEITPLGRKQLAEIDATMNVYLDATLGLLPDGAGEQARAVLSAVGAGLGEVWFAQEGSPAPSEEVAE